MLLFFYAFPFIFCFSCSFSSYTLLCCVDKIYIYICIYDLTGDRRPPRRIFWGKPEHPPRLGSVFFSIFDPPSWRVGLGMFRREHVFSKKVVLSCLPNKFECKKARLSADLSPQSPKTIRKIVFLPQEKLHGSRWISYFCRSNHLECYNRIFQITAFSGKWRMCDSDRKYCSFVVFRSSWWICVIRGHLDDILVGEEGTTGDPDSRRGGARIWSPIGEGRVELHNPSWVQISNTRWGTQSPQCRVWSGVLNDNVLGLTRLSLNPVWV